MKKTVSIIMSMLLVVTMMTALAGCGSDTDRIVGKWETTLDLGAMFDESLKSDSDMAEMADTITFHSVDAKVVFDFKDDGTYTLEWDEDSSKTALESIKSDLKAGLGTYITDMFSDDELGMSAEEAMEMMGMSMDEMIDELLNEMDVESMLDELNSKGKYKIEDGKLYMTSEESEEIDENSYDKYEFVSDSELKLLEPVGDDAEFAKSLYPITLKKV